MAKLTGETPEVIHQDGTVTPFPRIGPARIQEQTRFLNMAARRGTTAVVLECMALKPEYQATSERMIAAHLAVITNARLDHMEEMGRDRHDVTSVLCQVIPRNGIVVLGEPQLLDVAGPIAEQRQCRIAVARNAPAGSGLEAAVTISRLVLSQLDIPPDQRQKAEQYLSRRASETGSEVASIEVHGYRAFPMWTVNDIDTFNILWPKLPERAWMVFNHRADRPLRTRSFAQLFGDNADRVSGLLVIGTHSAVQIFRKTTPPHIPIYRIRRPATWSELALMARKAGIEPGAALVGCGNWKGAPSDAD